MILVNFIAFLLEILFLIVVMPMILILYVSIEVIYFILLIIRKIKKLYEKHYNFY